MDWRFSSLLDEHGGYGLTSPCLIASGALSFAESARAPAPDAHKLSYVCNTYHGPGWCTHLKHAC